MENIGFIGFGNMAQALAMGFNASEKGSSYRIFAYAPNQKKLKENCSRIGSVPCASLGELVSKCDTIFFACKPYQIEGVLGEIGKDLEGKQLVSVAAGWDYERFTGLLPETAKIQCIMPNTPVSVSEGVLLVAEENNWDENEREELLNLLGSVGRVVELPTRLMNAGMAVSGCGPAFVDMIIEALADGAVKNGIQRKQAYELVCQTLIGSAKLQLETGIHPGELKDNVCSPGGVTIKGVAVLEEEGVRSALIKAIDVCAK